MLLAYDRRPEKIEIENAQKEGGYSLTFKFRPASLFAAAGRAAVLLLKWHTVAVVGDDWTMDTCGLSCIDSTLAWVRVELDVTRRDGLVRELPSSVAVGTPLERLWNACWGNWRRWSRSYQDRSIQGSLTAAS